MALTQFTFGNAGLSGNTLPYMGTHNIVSESVTPSASNQQTTAVARANHNVVRVSTDTAVYVMFGTSPNALTGTTARFFLPAGATELFGVVSGWKAAVVTAP